MAQEDIELLLKDLYTRLPYGVKFKGEYDENLQEIHYIKDEEIYTRTHPHLPYWIETIKPYLRPMSSMTEKEKKEAKENGCIIYHDTSPKNRGLMVIASPKGIDWLNAHHFDYHGLIEKGLALEAPEGMYNN